MFVARAAAGSYRVTGGRTWAQCASTVPLPRHTPRFDDTARRLTEPQLLSVHVDLATTPYYNPVLFAHVRRHLPGWAGFRTEFHTVLHSRWNSIYLDWDPPTGEAGSVTVEEAPLGRRDRLMQLFEACPVGSYGYYARDGLAPFKAVVGDLAAATIDEFFAGQAHFLKQPFGPQVNEVMSLLETNYWDSRDRFSEWLAGKTFTQGMRKAGVGVAAAVRGLWEGGHAPTPPGEALDGARLAEVVAAIESRLDDLDARAFEALATELYERAAAAGRIGEARKEQDGPGGGRRADEPGQVRD